MEIKKDKKYKFLYSFIVILLLCCVLLFGCASNSNDDSSKDNSTNNDSQTNNNPPPMDNLGGGGTGTIPTEITYTQSELEIMEASSIDLTELKSNVNLSDAVELGTDGVINGAGSYVLSSDYANGITINANKGDTVHLYLNNANIAGNESSAIIKSDKAINLIITVLDNTTNTISVNTDSCNAIHVKGNLSINGTGNLNVNATGSDSSGIKVSKVCSIVDANISITSTKHGISAESIIAQDASVSITGSTDDSKDGLHSECDFDNKKGTTYDFTLDSGYVILKNTTYECQVYGDGIDADTFVYIDGGSYDIKTIGNFVKYSDANKQAYELEDDDFRYIKNGTQYQKVASDYNGNISSRYALAQSCKGIKVGEIDYDTDGDDIDDVTIIDNANYAIIISSGDFDIESTDDSIHSNSGCTFIKNGTFTINTCDDGITSDLLTQIDNGNITIESSYEGIEGAYVKINGGTIDITSSDDGINSASDDTSIKEYIIITGGQISVDASGDGLDSNGSILITGGDIIVHGPTSGGDGALDAETGIIVEGGNLIAYSSLGMVETPSTNSTQYVVSYGQNSQISSGTVVSLKDSDGNEILTFTTKKNSGSIIISTSQLTKNNTYNLYVGQDSYEFTVNDIITQVGSSSQQGGPNGGFPGGNQGPQPPRR